MLLRPAPRRIDEVGLVGRWTFDDGSCLDVSGRRNNGTPTSLTFAGGIGLPSRKGLQRLGAKFDGSASKIDLPALGVSGNTARTFSAWINLTTTASIRCLFLSGVGTNDNLFAVYHNVVAAGDLYVAFNNDDFYTAGGVIATNRWTHVCAMFAGGSTLAASNPKVYVDGVVQSLTKAGSFFLPSTTDSNYAIGYDYSAAGRNFSGIIDDVRLYNVAKSTAEVFALSREPYYQSEFSPGDIALLASVTGGGGGGGVTYPQLERGIRGLHRGIALGSYH